MKKLTLPFILILFAASALAQSSGTAIMDENYCITLDSDMAVYDQYAIDVSGLDFDTKDEAQKVFDGISSNLVSFRLDAPSRTATMILHTDRTGQTAWTKADWIDYFDSRCTTN